MMQIHTTQNLNSVVRNNQLMTNSVSTRDFRLKNYSEQMPKPEVSATNADFYSSSVSFGKKKPDIKDAKKVIEVVKKKVGEIKKDPQPEKKRGDGFLTGSFFDKILNVTDYETVATALVAAVCCGLRGGAILSIPTKKDKENNMYAASHAWASGIMGLITAFVLTAPFKSGKNYVMRHMKQDLDVKALERLWPHLDTKTITKADGKTRKPIGEWLDSSKNKFVEDIKGCEKLPVITHLADASEKTFEKILGVSVDWASQKGKSFNDVVLKDGRNLYDVIPMSKLGIRINDESVGKGQIMLQDMNSGYLEELVKDANNSKTNWSKLDVNSVYTNKGTKEEAVKDFREWKDVDGKQWKLDLDEVGVSSPYETADYRPRISGKKRYDEKDKEYKFYAYQKNGKDGKLGTEISEEMVKADAANDGVNKLLTWGPDLIFRVPIAATTIALIPWVLKRAFGIQKKSAKTNDAQAKEAPVAQKTQNLKEGADKTKEVAFKGKGGTPKKTNWFIRKFGEWYGKPLMENPTVYKVSKWFSKLPGSVTEHMNALGSLITSSVYMQQTLTKKDLDPEKRRTLAINQGLCFVVPTIMAYTVDHFIQNSVKNIGYRYTGLKERKIDIAKLENKSKEVIDKETATLSKKLKGIGTLASITVFAMVYRFLTPVIITPFANKIGDWNNARIAAKRAAKAGMNDQ